MCCQLKKCLWLLCWSSPGPKKRCSPALQQTLATESVDQEKSKKMDLHVRVFLSDVKLYSACEGGQGFSLMEDTKWAVNWIQLGSVSSCAFKVSVLQTGYNNGRQHQRHPSTHSSLNDLLIARRTLSCNVEEEALPGRAHVTLVITANHARPCKRTWCTQIIKWSGDNSKRSYIY